MYTPTPEVVAQAFDLGRPLGDLVLVRRGDTDTWRLDTAEGSYLVKGYWSSSAGRYAGRQLLDQLEAAMAFERRALEAGIDMAEPIPPTDPTAGWVTRLDERLFRVYRWVENRELRPDDDLAGWLGRTMARIHQLKPLSQVGLPDWWRSPVWPRATWEEWFAEARRRDKSWSDLAQERLPSILEMSERIERLCEVAADCVTTHGDFKTHNMVMAPTGPVLVDWDSVRVDSAALEAGRVAYIFGAAGIEPIRRILAAYVAAGGEVSWAGRDLFLSVARHDLQVLFERILVSLERAPAARWMGDSQTTEHTIGELLRELPDTFEHLGRLAAEMSDIGSTGQIGRP
ncbi:phosphotransferase [Actinopolymorpha pittospori]|uniref:Aminoglycoside phosphotransferase (APT) family kinase protein n=1 Tax=Actinopolymorpha pittospori TaxID=648752 RepID=A0A927N5S2_9ACTN|nr:aminoglycoside phosphotransferase (APT) family kinase protein [Actinopolymorpha pittospori]